MPFCPLKIFIFTLTGFFWTSLWSTEPGKQDVPRDISVLPIESDVIDKGLASILADDFRRFLAQRGFQVMGREMMDEIMQENALQMSGVCDESSCMVEAGRIMGISGIVSLSVTQLGENYWAASAKLVSVESGKVLVTASERREGQVFEINQRMFRNLASVLAGNPNKDHNKYLTQLEKKEQEQRFQEDVQSNFWQFYVEAMGDNNIGIVQPDRYDPVREHYKKKDDVQELELPKSQLEYGLRLLMAYRLESIAFLAGISMKLGKTRNSHLYYTDISDTTMGAGSGAQDWVVTTFYEGVDAELHKRLGLHFGIKKPLLQSARFALGLQALPEVGYLWVSFQQRFAEQYQANIFIDDIHERRLNAYTAQTTTASISSIVFGAELQAYGEYYITDRLSITGGVGLNYAIAPSLEGEADVEYQQTVVTEPENISGVATDSTYKMPIAFMKGDLFGTGDFQAFINPDEPPKDSDGDLVNIKRTFMELSVIRIVLAVGYSF